MEDALRGHGLTVRRVETRDLDHARELAREAAAAGEIVVTLSGDGLVGRDRRRPARHSRAPCIGVLPGGRGNDLARVLALPEDARRPARRSPTASPGRSTSGSSASGSARTRAGLRGDRLGRLRQRRQPDRQRSARPGSEASSMPTAPCGPWSPGAPRSFEIELLPSGERHSFTGYTVAAANSRAYGGGMYLAPRGDARRRPARRRRHRDTSASCASWPTSPRSSRAPTSSSPSVRVFRAAEVTDQLGPPLHHVRRRRPDRRAARAGPGARRRRHDHHPPQAAPAPGAESSGRAGAPAAGDGTPHRGLMSRLLTAKLALARGVGTLSRIQRLRRDEPARAGS